MSPPKRQRPLSREEPPLPSSLTSIKATNPSLYTWRLVSHLSNLPSHPASQAGWWCTHPTAMRHLLNYLSRPPETSQQLEPWQAFRSSLSVQLAHCRQCAVQYHKAFTDWELDLASTLSKKEAAKTIRALVSFDVERLVPSLKASPLITPAPSDPIRARIRAREAFLECLLSLRLCNAQPVSEAIGLLFKRGTLVSTNDDMKPFLQNLGVVPSGLMALCFHPSFTVRAWAKRVIYEACPNPANTDANARAYLFRKVIRVLPRQANAVAKAGDAPTVSPEARKASWEGFGALFNYMRRVQILEFDQTLVKGELFEILITNLRDSDEGIAAIAAECAITMLKELLSKEIHESDWMSVDNTVDTVARAFHHANKVILKVRLLYLLPLIVTKSQSANSKRAAPRVFQRCFAVVENAYKSSAGHVGRYDFNLHQTGSRSGQDIPGSALRAGASLMQWYYAHAVPCPPFLESRQIVHILHAALRAEPHGAWAWDLLRTVLITDVFSVLGGILKTPDIDGIGQIVRRSEALCLALGGEHNLLIENAVKVTTANKSTTIRVSNIWSTLEEGKHVRMSAENQSNPVPLEEVKILLDLHQLVGMVDPACIDRANDQTSSARIQTGHNIHANENQFAAACEKIASINRVIKARFLKACTAQGAQQWWDLLPFHATHLLASADKEIANKTFSALTKYRNLVGATCSGSRSRLLASDLKSDADGGTHVAEGCLSAMRMVSALGSSTSMRTYATLLTWYRVLVQCKYPRLLENDNWNWILGLILTFLRGWKRFERSTERVVFSEVCCRFLENLRDVWTMLSGIDRRTEDPDKHEVHQCMLHGILKGLLSMDTLRGQLTRGSWVTTVCALAPSWKDVREFREKMVLTIQFHEAQRDQLSLEQCQAIAGSCDLQEVNRPLQRWAADIGKDANGNTGSKKRQTKIDQFSVQAVSRDGKIPGRLVERRVPGMPFIGREFAAKEALKSSSSSRAVHRALGPSSAINDLRKEVRGTHKDSNRLLGKRSMRTEARPPVLGGKTKFELLVEKERAKKKNRREMMRVNKSYATTIRDANLHQDPRRKGNRTTPAATEIINSESSEEDLTLPTSRRTLRSRTKEQFYPQAFQSRTTISLRGDNSELGITKLPDSFDDVESYVKYWEPIIVMELRASLQSLVGEEQVFAEKQTPGDCRGCRTAFTVEGPIESVGHIQNLSLRYSDEPKKAQISFERGIMESNFDVAKVQISDVVLLHIPPSKYAISIGQPLVITKVFGVVVKVVRNGGNFQLKLNVAFESADTAPGKGREITVSRLTSLSTFHRQLDGLHGLPDLSDGVLWNVLEPRRSLEVKHKLCSEQYCTVDAVKFRLNFVQRLRSKNVLNNSQANAIEDVIRACAAVFRPKLRQQALSADPLNHGSMTLIQGPPGTGKTSTIIGLLSTLLFPGGEARPWRRTRVQFDDGSVVMPLAPVRILVCAPSNAAVDEIMHRLMERGLQTPAGCNVSPRMVRVGGGTTRESIRNLEIRSIADKYMSSISRNGAAASSRNMCALRKKIESLSAAIGALEKESSEKNRDVQAIDGDAEEELKKLKAQRLALHSQCDDELENMILADKSSKKEGNAGRKREVLKRMSRFLNVCSVVFATLSSSGHEIMQNFGAKPDIIVVDEAAQCGEPEALIPMTATRAKGASHVVLVGDPKQLPATVISTNKVVSRALGRSLFERIGESCPLAVHMLDTQYRMHPEICSFPSERFYSGKLLNGASVKSDEMSPAYHQDPYKRFGPCTFLDTSKAREEEHRGSGGSLCNTKEARTVVCAITALIQRYEDIDLRGQIAVLSPYRQQVSTLRRMIAQNATLREAGIEVSTIDGIQGREKSIVFISTVRSGHSRGIGFVDDEKRMNVAITRARHTLIVIGNAEALETHSELWKAFISHCRSRSRLSVLPRNPDTYFPESRRRLRTEVASRIASLGREPESRKSKKKRGSRENEIFSRASTRKTASQADDQEPGNRGYSRGSKRKTPESMRDGQDVVSDRLDRKRLRPKSSPTSANLQAPQTALHRQEPTTVSATTAQNSSAAIPATAIQGFNRAQTHAYEIKHDSSETLDACRQDGGHPVDETRSQNPQGEASAVRSVCQAKAEASSQGPAQSANTYPNFSCQLKPRCAPLRSRPLEVSIQKKISRESSEPPPSNLMTQTSEIRHKSRESRPVPISETAILSESKKLPAGLDTPLKRVQPGTSIKSSVQTSDAEPVRLRSQPLTQIKAASHGKMEAGTDASEVGARVAVTCSDKQHQSRYAPGTNLKRSRKENGRECPAEKRVKTRHENMDASEARASHAVKSGEAVVEVISIADGDCLKAERTTTPQRSKGSQRRRATKSDIVSDDPNKTATARVEEAKARSRIARVNDLAEQKNGTPAMSTGAEDAVKVPKTSLSVFQRLGQRVHGGHQLETSGRLANANEKMSGARNMTERQRLALSHTSKHDSTKPFCRELSQPCSRKSDRLRGDLERKNKDNFLEESGLSNGVKQPLQQPLQKSASASQPPAFPFSLEKAKVDMERRQNQGGRSGQFAQAESGNSCAYGFRATASRQLGSNDTRPMNEGAGRGGHRLGMEANNYRGFPPPGNRYDRHHAYPSGNGWTNGQEQMRWDEGGYGQGHNVQRRGEPRRLDDGYRNINDGHDRYGRSGGWSARDERSQEHHDRYWHSRQLAIRDRGDPRFPHRDVAMHRDDRFRQRR